MYSLALRCWSSKLGMEQRLMSCCMWTEHKNHCLPLGTVKSLVLMGDHLNHPGINALNSPEVRHISKSIPRNLACTKKANSYRRIEVGIKRTCGQWVYVGSVACIKRLSHDSWIFIGSLLNWCSTRNHVIIEESNGRAQRTLGSHLPSGPLLLTSWLVVPDK